MFKQQSKQDVRLVQRYSWNKLNIFMQKKMKYNIGEIRFQGKKWEHMILYKYWCFVE